MLCHGKYALGANLFSDSYITSMDGAWMPLFWMEEMNDGNHVQQDIKMEV